MTKKSQTEIFGLAIVVVLILIAIVFVARFFLNKNSSSEGRGVIVSEQATAMITAIINTNSECSNLKFSELFRRCAETQFIPCAPNSCDYLNGALSSNFLAETFGEWNTKYRMELYAGGEKKFTIPDANSGCDINPRLDKEESSVFIPLSTPGENLEIKLAICN